SRMPIALPINGCVRLRPVTFPPRCWSAVLRDSRQHGLHRRGCHEVILNDPLLFSCLATFVMGLSLRPRPYSFDEVMRPILSLWWHGIGVFPAVSSRWGAAGACAGSARTMRAAAALAIAALAGGCFQPLYGEQSPTGGPVLRDQLSAVDVLQ